MKYFKSELIFGAILLTWVAILTYIVLVNDGQSVHRDVEIMDKIIKNARDINIQSEAVITNQQAILDLYKRLGVK